MQQQPKAVPEFKNGLHLLWSALPEKAIDSRKTSYHKRLQAFCVSQRWTF